MPTNRPIRAATGNHRRQPIREVQREYRHVRGLTTGQVDLRSTMQHDILSHDAFHIHLLEMLNYYITMRDQLDEDDELMPDVMAKIDTIADIINANAQNRGAILNEEQQLFDINPDEDQPIQYGPPALRSFDEWDDRRLRAWTGYTVNELREIAEHFVLCCSVFLCFDTLLT